MFTVQTDCNEITHTLSFLSSKQLLSMSEDSERNTGIVGANNVSARECPSENQVNYRTRCNLLDTLIISENCQKPFIML